MTPDDVELVLAQSCLVAKAEALSRGQRAATLEEEAEKLRVSLLQTGLWRGENDANALNRYSLGEISLRNLAQYFSSRS